MSEEDLTEILQKLLTRLIDKETLELFGWPDKPVDVVLYTFMIVILIT